ncbi:ABC transporter permease [Vreelandella aquamarina]|jgi:tripartite ATP-independent transporter DctM subunit|uniref:TRAP transporter large permease protein n=1 Tax=Vreelandella aquamarina TaxID=77097 RepID=A0A1N6DB66_9GAMM|nr:MULTISPECIES: TRAP transporter large permease [Halomonas]MCP1304751.1 TRAP transporter large permease [Halomonas sp. R1t8]MCP1330101.1 TRAP transporter large permease [Halomonas sp. R1t4]PHR00417.1 MAG: TRAP transporter large permease [Halomonas sp.]SEO13601.1 TRAP transporter, DctM subunit [Halomonas aquamarina]SIN60732.1 TRAP transporter, DctM subunit [Halomonas meridiana]|tara:strand:+ start:549 stop:1823 length:1275 start_codon:yes stop_codon:yes gene_type:complete
MTPAIIAFVVLLFIGAPVAVVMAMSGLAGGFAIGGERMLGIIADRMFSGVSGFLLIAVPYFIFTAELMNQGGLTHKLIAFNNALFGRVRGSLSHVNISVSVFFAGLTGAAVTDTVAIGKIMIPEMKKQGYDAEYAAAVTACSSIIGPIIPPSVVMVVYATLLRDISVIDLFAGGIIPGLLMAVALLGVSFFLAWKRNYPKQAPTPFKMAVMSFVLALPALVVPMIILGGILSGLTTITEASGFAAVYAIVIGVVFYRNLTWRKIWQALVTTVRFSGVVFFLLATSAVLGWFVTRSGIARDAASIITTFSDVAFIQLMLVCLLLLLIGTVMDVLPALVVIAPVLVPAMIQLGFDPLHFAILMIVVLNISNVTPPVGMTLMTAARIAEVPYERAIVASLPFYVSFLVVIVLLAAFPVLSTWIPSLL